MGDKVPSSFGAPPPVSMKPKRRRPVPGEDLPALKNVMKEIQNQVISLEDFMLLISPHTGDKGAALTQVMTEDLQYFRRMVIKLYDTTSQDITDVITNEQLELAKMYMERQQLYINKIMRALQEIEDIVPGFDFKHYYQDPAGYLNILFKMAEIPDDEEVEETRRQLAYHRIQWLRAEGERLQAENKKLQARLNTLKKLQREEITEAMQEEMEAAKKKENLEKQQAEAQTKLEELSAELEDTMVSEEKPKGGKKRAEPATGAVKKKKSALKQGPAPRAAAKGKGETVTTEVTASQLMETVTETSDAATTQTTKVRRKIVAKKSRQSLAARPPFQTGAEDAATDEAAADVPVAAAAKRRPDKKKKRVSIKERPVWQDVELDELSAAQDTAEVPVDIFGAGGSQARPRAPSPQQRPQRTEQPEATGRRAAGPRDTWGGFY